MSEVTVTTTSPCDSFVFLCIDHNYDCYNGSHLMGTSSSFGSVLCGSATTTDPEGH